MRVENIDIGGDAYFACDLRLRLWHIWSGSGSEAKFSQTIIFPMRFP